MLEVEATYVAREKEDHLLWSTDELRNRLAHLQTLWRAADGVLEQAVAALPERERLAVSCLLVRDLYFVLELHSTHLGRQSGVEPVAKQTVQHTSLSTAELTKIPFNEWLFDEADDEED
jgi:hypothetical protein